VCHSYSTHHLALSQLRDVAGRQSDTHRAQMHLGRLGESARQREGDLGDPSFGCGRELVLVDMNLWLWSPSCGTCGYRLLELVAVVMNFL
jgi:hypothetical protein